MNKAENEQESLDVHLGSPRVHKHIHTYPQSYTCETHTYLHAKKQNKTKNKQRNTHGVLMGTVSMTDEMLPRLPRLGASTYKNHSLQAVWSGR